MKRVNVKNGSVDSIELNIADQSEQPNSYVVADDVEVFSGYIDSAGVFAAPTAPTPSNDDVTTERDRRTNLPVTVALTTGKTFDVDMAKGGRANIGDLALMAVIKNGAGITTDFTFRDANNTDHQLTNDEVIEMGIQAAAAYDAIYKKSWALKAMSPIPTNYKDDTHWT